MEVVFADKIVQIKPGVVINIQILFAHSSNPQLIHKCKYEENIVCVFFFFSFDIYFNYT